MFQLNIVVVDDKCLCVCSKLKFDEESLAEYRKLATATGGMFLEVPNTKDALEKVQMQNNAHLRICMLIVWPMYTCQILNQVAKLITETTRPDAITLGTSSGNAISNDVVVPLDEGLQSVTAVASGPDAILTTKVDGMFCLDWHLSFAFQFQSNQLMQLDKLWSRH